MMCYIIYSLIVVFAAILFCITSTWENISINEIIFQIRNFGGKIDKNILYNFLRYIFLYLVLYNLYFIFIFYFKKYNKSFKYIYLYIPLIIFLIFSIIRFGYKVNIYHYIKYRNDISTFIDDNYVDPKQVNIEFKEKKNLILIYLESMEITYSDKKNGGIFDYNLIPNLTLLAQENEDFSGEKIELNGAFSLVGTTFTMASLFGQSTGLPLVTPGLRNMMKEQNTFFPNIVAIGDILSKNGYNQIFLQGSDATFNETALFLKSHGDYEIIDYNYIMKNKLINDIDKDYFVFWGIEDHRLIDIAKRQLLMISKDNNPFNMTIMTIDTHAASGYLSKFCQESNNNKYISSLSCSDSLIGNFISWVKQQDFYKNTVIVIVGDHPTIQGNVIDYNFVKSNDYIRKIYTCYINSVYNNNYNKKYRLYSSFDNFPTILAAIGAEIEGDRLGLGTNLFSNSPTLSEKYGYLMQHIELSKQTYFFENKSNFIVNDQMIINKQCHGGIFFTKIDQVNNKIFFYVLMNNDNNIINDIFLELYNYNNINKSIRIKLKKENDVVISNRNFTLFEKSMELTNYSKLLYLIKLFVNKNDGSQDDAGFMMGDLTLKTIDIINYLNSINNNKYIIFISARGDMSGQMNSDIEACLKKLGSKYNFANKKNYSYYAVINDNQIREDMSYHKIEMKGILPNTNIEYRIISAGEDSGDISSIKIDGFDYSRNQRGLNFVIYSKEFNRVVDVSSFDTSSGEYLINIR